MVVEKVLLFPTLLDDTDYVDPFQLGFQLGDGTEAVLVSLVDDQCWENA